MNIRAAIAALLPNPKRFLAKKRRIALAHIWYGELAIGALLLIAVLSFDWMAYRSLVTASPGLPQEEIQKLVMLDERAVKGAAETIAQHNAFLQHPTFPALIQSPF